MKSQLFQLAAVALLAAGALATSTTTNEDASSSAPSRPTSGNSGECQYPADVLDLQSWKVTLPTGGDDAEEIKQPELATFAADPWFVATENCDGIRFRSAVNGATTGNSAYPRSELREMVSDGSDEAGWSTTEGTHTLTAKLAFTATPNDKPHVVGAQVHGGDDDVTVFRLEGTELWITDGDEPHHHLITDNYQLGTVFEAKFVASDGKIEAYYNGELQTTVESDASEAYFKTGAYTQANCEKSDPCDESNYGEVVLYELNVEHRE